MITFKEVYNKLVLAYLKDQVRPTDPCACFIGNILNNKYEWRYARRCKLDGSIRLGMEFRYLEGEECIAKESDNTYNWQEIQELENIFMNTWMDNGSNEDSLYLAFEKALLRLKEIHESKGETVEDYIFKKRELVK